MSDHIVVVGLGYVGLPLALALARSFRVTGFDIDQRRIAELQRGEDRTREIDSASIAASTIAFTADAEACKEADIYIITVPTPVDDANRPDLGPVISATGVVAKLIDATRRPVIVYESTVYPGVTEETCGPIIEEMSGLKRGRDFFLGYSPERINPGDREHTIDRIVKVVAGENDAVTERLAEIYGRVTSGGVFRAASIKTAEAAKVIENAQRDINIAFMNEIAQIFERLGLSARHVLEAAGTKWNFLSFHPGLVGGHCIGVDPYYLSHCAQSLGHLPRVILAGRAINDGMGTWIADNIHSRLASRAGAVLVLGLAFKPNVADIRNSKVVDVITRLKWLGHTVTVHDPFVDQADARVELDVEIDPVALDRKYDCVVLAVPHDSYKAMTAEAIRQMLSPGALLADLQGTWQDRQISDVRYWVL